MNKGRRKNIAKAVEMLAQVREMLEILRDEEQEYFDNMPENFQSGEKGETSEAAIAAMDEAISQVEEAETSLADLAS